MGAVHGGAQVRAQMIAPTAAAGVPCGLCWRDWLLRLRLRLLLGCQDLLLQRYQLRLDLSHNSQRAG